MAGRGRGKSSGTLTQEQLQSMGVTRSEMQTVSSAAPPPLYPLLQSKPVPLESNPDRDYKILWKEDFISYLRESPYYSTMKSFKGPVQRYSDKVINVIENDPKRKQDGGFIWSMMPAELKPSFKRSKANPSSETQIKAKRSKTVDIDAKLNELEKKESFLDESEVKKEKNTESDEEKGDDELEEEMVDEEMDDENDYGNNYFDNGEAYNEEDDNLDDGPVY
ncbi:DNA-directed RNA polymerase III subunit RPC7 [Malaya genurostris]|uniref:DNA-directed RNA polymerase III subunit RPC7 n=1 Tax=Malaya genurostris TaxID=325434 RepID=UPI0026F3F807|nr:DNA-directed RNA polymerase III subunit RPC7 [Malaya genurostris]XP_058460773.1 DNA-directed RNA polymerase III subunit RPC7 [Malaya genurostris]